MSHIHIDGYTYKLHQRWWSDNGDSAKITELYRIRWFLVPCLCCLITDKDGTSVATELTYAEFEYRFPYKKKPTNIKTKRKECMPDECTPKELAAGQIYESATGERIIVVRIDADLASIVATNGAFVRNNVPATELKTMFPNYRGETTVSYS